MAIVAVGVDLAKSVFAIHGVDATGKAVLIRPRVPRDKLLEVLAALPPCVIGMEACSGAHEWARQLKELGHEPKLMAPKFVTPYRANKRIKNDAADAAAICEAVMRPTMRFVPIKSQEQQARLFVHRARQGFVAERTATLNRIRGLLAEMGVVLPLKADTVRRRAGEMLEELPSYMNTVIGDLLSHVHHLDERLKQYEVHLKQMALADERSKRLMQMPGIGEITASALVATIGNGRDFKNGRQLAAWLGLVPSQHSSGGKNRHGHITKVGDRYIRMLLILGSRSVLNAAATKTDRLSRWALSVKERCGYGKALVAIAAKNARMAWAMLSKGEGYTPMLGD